MIFLLSLILMVLCHKLAYSKSLNDQGCLKSLCAQRTAVLSKNDYTKQYIIVYKSISNSNEKSKTNKFFMNTNELKNRIPFNHDFQNSINKRKRENPYSNRNMNYPSITFNYQLKYNPKDSKYSKEDYNNKSNNNNNSDNNNNYNNNSDNNNNYNKNIYYYNNYNKNIYYYNNYNNNNYYNNNYSNNNYYNNNYSNNNYNNNNNSLILMINKEFTGNKNIKRDTLPKYSSFTKSFMFVNEEDLIQEVYGDLKEGLPIKRSEHEQREYTIKEFIKTINSTDLPIDYIEEDYPVYTDDISKDSFQTSVSPPPNENTDPSVVPKDSTNSMNETEALDEMMIENEIFGDAIETQKKNLGWVSEKPT